MENHVAQATDWAALAGRFYWVDAGSRGGFHDLRLLHPLVHMYSVDADLDVKPEQQDFASFRHLSVALYSSEGDRDLFVTVEPEMTSLLEFDEAAFMRHFGLIPGSDTWRRGLAAAHTQKTRTRTADELFESQGLPRVDLFKLDTQGTELEVLKGALGYLRTGRISVIKTEVSLLPFYRNQCTFGDIDRFLRELGFLFVDLAFHSGTVRASSAPKAVRGVDLQEQLSMGTVGDAVYVLDPVRYGEGDRAASTVRSAILLNQMGYVSIAFDLLSGAGYGTRLAQDLLRATARQNGSRAKVGRWLEGHLPPWAWRHVRRIGRPRLLRSRA